MSSPGAGHPRLMFALGGEMATREPQREFDLVGEVTTIGSDPDADLCLAGLELRHAEIRRDADDDYTFIPLSARSGGSVNGRPGERAVLRTGTRIELGTHTVSFYREESADGVDPTGSPTEDSKHEATDIA